MEHLWDAVVATFTAITGYIVWMFKKHGMRVDAIDKRLTDTEKTQAVSTYQLADIKEDIHEIKEGIRRLIGDK